jgi:predicted ATPase/class 3 adenylate cyclase/tRNA A-37 threonylcarbamoyl transferase component Bud32
MANRSARLEQLEKIHEGQRSIVYRARLRDRNVVVKVLRGPYPTLEQQARFRREFDIGRALNGPGIIEALELETRDDTLAIVSEDCGGKSLDRSGPLALTEFLPLASGIASGLARIHANAVVHKDINPSNIVWNRATGIVKIIDFGISSTLSRDTAELQDPHSIQGTLAYLAPEQTGRTNRDIDHRCDLYALGVTFYELLSGRKPFVGNDPLELVHAHIARTPAPPDSVDPAVPAVLSALVMKLLEKNPDDRYQSALGIKHDLDECLVRLRATGRIDSFALAEKDVAPRLQLPQGLYGRTAEVSTLLTALERTAAGAFQLLLVAGYSGIGKTRLVQEIRRPAAARQAHFVSGKFDQFRRDVPYASLSEALGQLVNHVLADSEATIADWRERVLNAASVNGRLLIELVPELEHVLGPQPPVPELPPAEAENRFHFTLRRFVRALATEAHPLVLFLDDLQWADLPSIRLLERLATDTDSHHLLIVCGYRNNEVSAAHPFALAVDAIGHAGANVERVSLGNLARADVAQFVADTLRTAPEEIDELAGLCFEKTQGNPFFLNQFLAGLYEAGLLRLAPGRGWSFDVAEIERRNITDNVVEFLVERIRGISLATQETLQIAACIGGGFDLATVSTLRGRPLEEIERHLHEALDEGLVQPQAVVRTSRELQPGAAQGAKHFSFVHDRVEQAAWSMVPEELRARTSRELARLLRAASDARQERIFEIAGHLKRAAALLETTAEKDEAVDVNLEAGRRARRSAAYAPALAYFEAALGFLDEASWTRRYERTLELHLEAAEAAFLTGDYARMDAFRGWVLAHVDSVLAKVRAHEVEIDALNAQNDLVGALKAGLGALRLLGVNLPEDPGKATLVRHLVMTKLRLRGTSERTLAALGNMADPEVLATMRLLVGMAPVAYYARPNLLPIISFQMVTLSVRYGISPHSAYAFAVYGLVLCSLGDIENGWLYGSLAVRYTERFDDPRSRTRAAHLYNTHIRFWKEPIAASISPLRGTFETAITNGDLEFAAFSAFMHCNMQLQAGRELSNLKLDMVRFGAEIRAMNQGTTAWGHAIGWQAVLNLLGEGAADPCTLAGAAYDELRMVPTHEERKDRTNLFVYYAIKLLLSAFFRRFEAGCRIADQSVAYSDGGVSTVYVPASLFYGALVRLGGSEPKVRQGGAERAAARQLRKLRGYAKHEPRCNTHRVLLLEAETARIAGQAPLAMARYEAALAAAQASGMVHEEALCAEWAGRYFQALGNATVARAYLSRARFLYTRWGAEAKVTDLDAAFPDLTVAVDAPAPKPGRRWTGTETLQSAARNLDLLSVMKASHALSGEIELTRVLRRLITIAVENAGAGRGLLIVERNQAMVIEAELSALDAEPVTAQSEPVAGSAKVPATILNYVIRTRKPVVLDDADKENGYKADPYFETHRPRSVLSVPLVSQGRLKGVLYLENEVAAGAFTAERIEVLLLLSTQAAISLENAGLYADLKTALEEQVRLTEAHKRFVPHEFLQNLGRRGIVEVALGDSVQKEMSILFSDMRGFTRLVEKLSPEENIRFINQYLGYMEPPILANGGFVEGYIGDAIMALFEGGADGAVLAGTDMLRALVEFNRARALAGEPPCRIGIGVNTGVLTLGTIGGMARIKCGVIGDSVNLAARVESITKTYGVALLVSDDTYVRLREPARHAIRLVDRVRVVGRARPVTLYEVFDADDSELRDQKLAIAGTYAEGLDAYYARDFPTARARFEQCLAALPEDTVLLRHRTRCQCYAERPPGADWDGTEELSHK